MRNERAWGKCMLIIKTGKEMCVLTGCLCFPFRDNEAEGQWKKKRWAEITAHLDYALWITHERLD